jgi:nucleotide-binding universal stress UspA family protein
MPSAWPHRHPYQRLAQDAPCAVAVAGDRGGIRLGPHDRIGVAYDGSHEADIALEAATALADATGARLLLIGVIEPGAEPARLWTHLRDAAGAMTGVGEVELKRGIPARAILDDTHDLALVVAGSRPIGAPGRVCAGSVSGALLANSTVPVLVTPRPVLRRTGRFTRGVAGARPTPVV